MYEEEKRGVSVITVIIVVVIFIVITLLTTFFATSYVYNQRIETYKKSLEDANAKIEHANELIAEANSKISDINTSIKKLDDKKDIVYSSKETIKGVLLNKPNINIDSRDVAKINSQINKFYEEHKSNINNKISSGSLTYTTYECDNLLAIIIEEKVSNNPVRYSVYNFNVKTGKSITNAELLEMKKTTRQKVYELISNKFDDENYLSTAEKKYNKSMIQNRLCISSVDLPMYIDSKGRLNIILLEQSTQSKYGFTNTIYTLNI